MNQGVLVHYKQGLIHTNQQDSDPSKYLVGLMTQEHDRTLFLARWVGVAFSIVALSTASFFAGSASGAPMPVGEVYGANTQNMRLLQSQIGVEITEPSGGSDDIVVEGGALAPAISTITDTAYKIENSCNPRNDSIEIYKVREGDTISDIATMFCISVDTIKWANNVGNGIRVGQELTILPVSGVMHDVEGGDTIAKIAKKYGGTVDEILAYNNLTVDDTLSSEMSIIVPGGKKSSVSSSSSSGGSAPSTGSYASATSGYYIKPTSGKITSPFGYRNDPVTGARRFHNGVDIANDVGTPVMAAASGRVIEARSSGWNGGYGKKIVILHGDGSKTLYAHLNSVSVSVGDMVDQGETIGAMGRTGRVTGPHLHFEVIGKSGKNLKPVF